MAGLGYRAWIPGEIIAADNINQYLMDQSVQVYANSAARGSALVGFVAEGMVSYLKDTNALEMFNGSSWISVAPTIPNATTTTRGIDFALPTGSENQYLRSFGGSVVAFSTLTSKAIERDTRLASSSFTVAQSDANSLITLSGTVTVTVTPSSLVDGQSVTFLNVSGSHTFAGSGTTVFVKNGILTFSEVYGQATLFKSANLYYLTGDVG